MKGIIYFLVIVFANTIGAVSGMGGGVIIKPILDFIAMDSVSSISFYSTVVVFTMSIVSTIRHMKGGMKFNWLIIFWISLGAIFGGVLGNLGFEILLSVFENESIVKLIQIIIIIITLIFAFFYTKYDCKSFSFGHFS